MWLSDFSPSLQPRSSTVLERRNALSEANFGLVWSAALRLKRTLPATVELDELVGDGALGLLAAAERFDADRMIPFRRFATRYIRGAMIDGLRRRRRWQRDLELASARELAQFDPGLLSIEMRDEADALIGALPMRWQCVLRGYMLEERPMKQVAAMMGISEPRVWRILHQALQRLRDKARAPVTPGHSAAPASAAA